MTIRCIASTPLFRLSVLVLALCRVGSAQVALSLSSASGSPGAAVNLNLSLSSSGNSPAALQWTLNYSTSDFSGIIVTAGASAISAGKSVSCNAASGSLTCILWGLNSTTIPDGVVATASLGISSSTLNSSSPVQVTNSVAASAGGVTITSSATGGVVTIAQSGISVTGISCNPSVDVPPAGVACQVSINNPAPALGTTVSLSSTSLNLVPPLVLIFPPGAMTASFSAVTIPVTATTSVQVTATLGASSASATVQLTPSSNSSGWYSTAWNYRKPITINHTQVSSSLVNFSVLVSLASDANLSSTAQASGNDILFTASDGVTKLNHQIESYTGSSGQLTAWVEVPSISATADTTIYMYYGNSSAASQQNMTGTWDGNYGAVLHFSSGANVSYQDSTSNNVSFTATGSSGGTAPAGKIGGAGSIGGGRWIGTYPTLFNIGNAARTISCWFKADGTVGASGYYDICGFTWSTGGFGFKLIPSQSVIGLATGTGTSTSNMRTIPYVADNTWHYLAATLDVGQKLDSALIYLDGVAKTTSGGTNIAVNTDASLDTGQWVTDGFATATGTSYTDEFRYSTSVRAPGWIATEYNNQNSPSTFISPGSQQSSGGGGGSPTVTVTSVPAGLTLTVDGASCTTPCGPLTWTAGTNHTIAAANQSGTTGTQYIFSLWSDGQAASHSVTAPASSATYTASFTTQYFLTTTANPSSEGSISPSSGWFNAGALVSVSATALSGNQFTGFTGAVTGTTSPASLTVNAPASVAANFTAVSQSWYSAAWSHRKPITINHAQVSGSLVNFSVLVSLASDTNLSSTAQAGGNDILFTASDGVTKLNHQIEFYTGSTGQLTAWVEVPSISATADTTIYMYYGNPSAPSQQNMTGTWDANYGAVLHFSSGANVSYQDSTSNNVPFTTNGSSGGAAPAGKIGGAGYIGGGRWIGTYPTLFNIGNAARTISCWFKADGITGASGYYDICGFTWSTGGFGFKLIPSQSVIGLATGTGTSTSNMRTIPYVADNTWHYLTATLDVGQKLDSALIYLDGVAKTTSGGTNIAVNTDASLDTGQWVTDGYAIEIGFSYTDEFRYSTSVRTPGWIATEYNNQNSPSTFVTVGGQQ